MRVSHPTCLPRMSNTKGRFNPVTPDSAKSKIDQFFKITNWVKLKNKQHHRKNFAQPFCNEWSHFRRLSIDSKVRKLCFTQGLTLGVKGFMWPNADFSMKSQSNCAVLFSAWCASIDTGCRELECWVARVHCVVGQTTRIHGASLRPGV